MKINSHTQESHYDMYINCMYLQICMHMCICTPDLYVCLVVEQPHVYLNTSHTKYNYLYMIYTFLDYNSSFDITAADILFVMGMIAKHLQKMSSFFLLLMNTHAAIKQWMDSKDFALGNIILSDITMKLTIQSRHTSHQVCYIF